MSVELKPVGFYCDHSDEPFDARTHHDWEWVEGEGHVFTHSPNTISSHGGTRDYLTPEQREQRCPRSVPVYAGSDVEALRAEVERLTTRETELADLLQRAITERHLAAGETSNA